MNKALTKRMMDLAELIRKHEEAVEKNFSDKSVAIVKYRTGLEGGIPHSMEQTAKNFKVSTAWVGKKTKDIRDFCLKADKKQPSQKKSKTAKKSAVKVAVMSVTIENGKVTVKHSDEKMAKKVEKDLQDMLNVARPAGDKTTKIFLGARSIKAGREASSRFVGAFVFFILGFVATLIHVANIDALNEVQNVSLSVISTLMLLISMWKVLNGMFFRGEQRAYARAAHSL